MLEVNLNNGFEETIVQWNYRKMNINGHFPVIPL